MSWAPSTPGASGMLPVYFLATMVDDTSQWTGWLFPYPALTTLANPVVASAPFMSEDPLSVVSESSNPLLALYSEAPTKTVLTLFWSSFVAPLLISCTPSFWWKLKISPVSALVSYGLASGLSLGLHYLLSFLWVGFPTLTLSFKILLMVSSWMLSPFSAPILPFYSLYLPGSSSLAWSWFMWYTIAQRRLPSFHQFEPSNCC